VPEPELTQARAWADAARSLDGEGWWLAGLCGLDRLGLRDEGHRFEVVVQLLHHERRERKMVRVAAEGEPPTVPSIVDVWPSATNMEREAFDLFGIHFEGHPKLTRILMPDEWEGHPLRKDYGVGKVPVEFIPQPFLQIDSPGQSPVGDEAGRELDRLGQAGPPERHAAPPVGAPSEGRT
jgi:NADH-quinone oxidoreductase subunit C